MFHLVSLEFHLYRGIHLRFPNVQVAFFRFSFGFHLGFHVGFLEGSM